MVLQTLYDNDGDGIASLTLQSATYADRFFLAEPLEVLSNKENIVESSTRIFIDNTNEHLVNTKKGMPKYKR